MKEYKNIGILTFHSIQNYGSILQAYALQKTILRLTEDNYKCNIIDLRPNNGTRKYKFNFHNVFNKVYSIIKYNKLLARANKFEEFVSEKMILSQDKYNSLDKVCTAVDNYDFLIAGSDEIWNSESDSFNLAYFLPFKCSAKKISYASSVGAFKSNSSKVLEGNIKSYLPNFDFLSVRESYLVDIIKKTIDKKCEVLIDPIFLEKDTEWRELISNKKIIKGRYILYYSSGSSKNDIKILKKIKKTYKIPIIMINSESLYDRLIYYRKILNCGPIEYLNLVKNAELVCTNTYYGIAFSIIFRRNFYCIESKEVQEIKLLLKKFGIENRIININNFNKVNNKSNINYVKVENQLINLRNYGIEFLKNVLK